MQRIVDDELEYAELRFVQINRQCGLTADGIVYMMQDNGRGWRKLSMKNLDIKKPIVEVQTGQKLFTQATEQS